MIWYIYTLKILEEKGSYKFICEQIIMLNKENNFPKWSVVKYRVMLIAPIQTSNNYLKLESL